MSPHAFDLDRIGAALPVATARHDLERAAASGALVVTAPPGTGKTTFVPPLIANLVGRSTSGAQGRVLLTQPRRLAVRAAAGRIASLDGGGIGGAVGFTVRGERRLGPRTRLEVLTPGVLLRRLIADPGLAGVSAVIVDEVHERSLEGDLLLGMVAEVRALRDDLVVVAMSATLDAASTAELLGAAAGTGPAPVVEISSALHELRIDYAPFDGERLGLRGVAPEYLAHLAAVAAEAQSADEGDALVFVPGAREVDEVVRLLRGRRRGPSERPVEILPLHGRLSARDQDRAVRGRRPSDAPRIVVSTALAESSLTVPGVRLVVDSGLSREVRRDRARDMAGLVTVSASRASSEQRAGRAAREAPGRAIRAYSEAEFARMPAASAPEIASADLTDAALLLAAWGTPGGEGLALPSPPPADAVRAATRVLGALGLVGEDGSPTALGARVARLPVGAREARALLEGAKRCGDAGRVAEVVAAMADDHRAAGADLTSLLRELRSGRAPGADRWRREAQRLERIAARPERDAPARAEVPESTGTGRPDSTRSGEEGAIVALARPEWIARRVGEHSRSYLLASGTRAALPEGSPLAGAEWLAVREVQRSEARTADGTGAIIRLAAGISEDQARDIGASLHARRREARVEQGRVRVREELRLGAILLSTAPVAPTVDDAGPAFAAHLRERGLAALHWSDAAASLRGRLALLHRELGEPWPDTGEAELLERIDDWLGPDLARLRPDAALRDLDVAAALRRLLPWPEAGRLDELAPERLAVPSGSTVRIDYPGAERPDGPPVVAVKLQEVFGLAETPRLAGGRAPILFHLLSPARRPLAVTDDLASFWSGPYREVRREMRGRYPKHPWPEDPWSAEATARTKRVG